MTGIEWLAWLALMATGLSVGAIVTLSNARVARDVRRLADTYRRQKSLELEQRQAELVARREREVRQELTQPGGLERVLNQLLADVLPGGAAVGEEGVLDVSISPAPRFTVAGTTGLYLFTTSPDALRAVKMLARKEREIPLDAAIHPAARVEVQAVWEHVAAQRLRELQTPTLPRQAEWFLVVRSEA